jgi:TatA/E family protein of Tat protein translocase
MGNIGSSELLIILVLALLLLGPKRLPEVGEALGKTLRKFKQASRDLHEEIDVRRELDAPPKVDDDPKK